MMSAGCLANQMGYGPCVPRKIHGWNTQFDAVLQDGSTLRMTATLDVKSQTARVSFRVTGKDGYYKAHLSQDTTISANDYYDMI